MSAVIDKEEMFCNSCHTEFVFDMLANEDIAPEDIKYCPLCGADLNYDWDDEEEEEFDDE